MQNRYTGDIGDYGKLGLLRRLQASGLTVGVNWYLVPDENHNKDGRYVQYLDDEGFRRYDEALWEELRSIVRPERRGVVALQKPQILRAAYYSEPLDYTGKQKAERASIRIAWHKSALNALSDLDIVFTDPDNGLLVPSAQETKRDNKYVKPIELADYFKQGSSVIYYQHKARKPDQFYIDQHRRLVSKSCFERADSFGLKFIKTSQRFYFFIVQPNHKETVAKAIDNLLSSAWQDCFESVIN